jgi:hypothetical protein
MGALQALCTHEKNRRVSRLGSCGNDFNALPIGP